MSDSTPSKQQPIQSHPAGSDLSGPGGRWIWLDDAAIRRVTEAETSLRERPVFVLSAVEDVAESIRLAEEREPHSEFCSGCPEYPAHGPAVFNHDLYPRDLVYDARLRDNPRVQSNDGQGPRTTVQSTPSTPASSPRYSGKRDGIVPGWGNW